MMRALVLLMVSVLAFSGIAANVLSGEQDGAATCTGFSITSVPEPSETGSLGGSSFGYLAIVGVGLAKMALTTAC